MYIDCNETHKSTTDPAIITMFLHNGIAFQDQKSISQISVKSLTIIPVNFLNVESSVQVQEFQFHM